MIVTILGSGTCVPSPERNSSSIWVRANKRQLLLDAGSGCIKRLMEAGGSLENIDTLFLSHFHPDHSGELVSILFSLKYGGIEKNYTEFQLMGGEGLSDFYQGLKNVYGHWIDVNKEIIIREFDILSKDVLDSSDIRIETFPVCHSPESVAVKIVDGDGKVFVFSGDMDETKDFDKFCKGADLLVIESATPDNMKKKGHITPSIAGEIAENAQVKRLVLTHFYPECEKVDMKKEASVKFKGRIDLARDLMEISL